MRTEPLDIDDRFGKEYAGHYVFSEITWAKRSRIIQKHTRYSKMTGQVESSDFVAIQAETIWASLKEQPESKPITLERLLSETDGIPIELGEIFSKVVNKLCNVSREETTFLSGQSEDKSQTLASQTSDSAKSSGGPQTSLPNNPQEPSNNFS